MSFSIFRKKQTGQVTTGETANNRQKATPISAKIGHAKSPPASKQTKEPKPVKTSAKTIKENHNNERLKNLCIRYQESGGNEKEFQDLWKKSIKIYFNQKKQK